MKFFGPLVSALPSALRASVVTNGCKKNHHGDTESTEMARAKYANWQAWALAL